MHIHLIAVGTRVPGWVEAGFNEYAKRLPHHLPLQLIEVPPGHRGKKGDGARETEGKRLVTAIPKGAHIVALDQRGKAWSTIDLANQLEQWMREAIPVALLVGGPDGLASSIGSRAHETWPLSNLPFPHSLVRVIVAEQLYRAWSLLTNHPYHRGARKK